MEDLKGKKGGTFLIESIFPQEVFTPEDYTEEHRLIAKATTEFVVGEVQPVIEEIEVQRKGVLPNLVKKAGELGLLSADIAEEYGGQNLDKISSLLITEKMALGGGSFFVAFVVQTGIGTLPIVFFGNKEQKRRYLPAIATGETITAYALTEPEAGSDALNAKSTATLSSDGRFYILNGQKQFISNAGFADLFITYAKVDGKKFTAFIVERKCDGVSLDEEEKKMGVKGSSTRSVIFTDVKVPVENVLGEIGRGHVVAFNTLNIGRLKLGPSCVGESKMALKEAVNYAKQRVQFGKKICEFGLMKHKMAEMAIRIFVAESMVYRTAGLIDHILSRVDQRAEDSGSQMAKGIEEYAIEDSINKVYSTEMRDYVVDEALQVFGGYGFIQDYPMERYYRDSRINRIWDGTNEINRLLIMDMLMKRGAKDRLPLRTAIQKTMDTVFSLPSVSDKFNRELRLQLEMVEKSKWIALVVMGAVAKKRTLKMDEEQEILASISDMVIEIFAMESALLRASKSMDQVEYEKSQVQKAMVEIYVSEACSRVIGFAKEALGAIEEDNIGNTYLSRINQLGNTLLVNTIALRREVAAIVIKTGGYPF